MHFYESGASPYRSSLRDVIETAVRSGSQADYDEVERLLDARAPLVDVSVHQHIRELADSDPKALGHAIVALSNNRDALPDVIRSLSLDSAYSERVSLVALIVGRSDSWSAIAEMLEDGDKDLRDGALALFARTYCSGAMSREEEQKAAERLADILSNEASSLALFAIGRLGQGSEKVVQVLQGLCKSLGTDTSLRESAIDVLFQLVPTHRATCEVLVDQGFSSDRANRLFAKVLACRSELAVPEAIFIANAILERVLSCPSNGQQSENKRLLETLQQFGTRIENPAILSTLHDLYLSDCAELRSAIADTIRVVGGEEELQRAERSLNSWSNRIARFVRSYFESKRSELSHDGWSARTMLDRHRSRMSQTL